MNPGSSTGYVIWFTGLPSSGKTTLANGLQKRLKEEGIFSVVLDSDRLRATMNKDLGYGLDDRRENIRRVAEVARLLSQNGILTLAAFITPTEEMRSLAKEIIGPENFCQVYVNTPRETCESRDPKGHYHKARAGLLKEFTGISSPFEEPLSAGIVIDTSNISTEQCLDILEREVKQRINERQA